VDPDAAEIRVLGCLIEKQRTTPDHYPLSLNALRQACNQSTNRDPVVDYDEHTVREAAQRLGRRRWSRLASGQGSRTAKYRHLLDEALTIGDDEISVLCVLLLRGPQTPGELKGRTERMFRFESLEDVDHTLAKLIARGHVERLARRPGQKEDRFAQTLGGDDHTQSPASLGSEADTSAAPPTPSPPSAEPVGALATPPPPPASAPDPRPDEVGALRAEVDALRGELTALRAEFAALRDELGG
jgi:uncharacterized protein YceH (UPF0502 family)